MIMITKSYSCDINGPRRRRGNKYSKYQKCLSMMMLIRTKQHLSNIWSSIHGKVKQHWGWIENNVAYIKKRLHMLYFFQPIHHPFAQNFWFAL